MENGGRDRVPQSRASLLDSATVGYVVGTTLRGRCLDTLRTDANARHVALKNPLEYVLPISLLFVAFQPQSLLGDGGAVLSSQRQGVFEITLFGSPVPLQVGQNDLSVLVQNASTQAPILDADAALVLEGPEGNVIRARLVSGAGTNKLLYSATVRLPDPGKWTVSVRCRSSRDEATIRDKITVVGGSRALFEFLPQFALIPVILALFGLNRWLKARRLRP
jgi:hypothetical protein